MRASLLRLGVFVSILASASPLLAERSGGHGSTEIPADLMTAVQRARHAILVDESDGTPAATNYKQQLRARFEPEGVSVTLRKPAAADAAPLALQLEAWGREDSMREAGGARRFSTAERAEYAYGGITEWWRNHVGGLEHGFDVDERPAGSGPLVVRVGIGRGWSAVTSGEGLRFDGANGERLAYDKLVIRDAAGRRIDGRMAPALAGFEIRVDDRGASYPLVIDPLVTNLQAVLEGLSTGGEAHARFGNAVAVSGDTAVVGAYGDDTAGGTDAGSAYVFLRSGTSWAQQAQLLPTATDPDDYFGYSVAVSGDTAVVGAPFDDTGAGGSDAGSAYVFARSGTSWAQQAQLLASDEAAGDALGISVAVSGDTAVVGAYLDDTAGGTNAGSAYVFLRSGTSWAQQAQLLPTGTDPGDSADLVIAKTLTSTPPYVAGGTLTYSISVTNNGPAAATNVIVTDVLPAGTSFVSATPSQGSCSGTGTVVCTIGSLPDDATATVTLTLRTPATPGTVTNSASVSATELDGETTNNAASAGATTAPAAFSPIPTLSEWMLLALAGMLAAVAVLRSRA